MIHVPWGGLGNDQGELIIEGTPIYSFAIGGQELWIDHICELGMEMDNTLPDDCFAFDNMEAQHLPSAMCFSIEMSTKASNLKSFLMCCWQPSASASAMPLSETDNQVDMGGALHAEFLRSKGYASCQWCAATPAYWHHLCSAKAFHKAVQMQPEELI